MYFKTLKIVQLSFIFAIVPSLYAQCLTEPTETTTDSTEMSIMDIFQTDAPSNLYLGQQKFTLDLLLKLQEATPNESIFFSPHSTYNALLLAYFGARNATEESLKNALRLEWADKKEDVVRAYLLDHKTRLADAENRSVDFNSVDKIFVFEQSKVKQCIQKTFENSLEKLNFAKDPEASRLKINRFVEDVTKGNIKDILVPGSLSAESKIVLANAAYFKGQWASKFNPRFTSKEIFYESGSKQVFVDMMKKQGYYNYATNEKLNCVTLEIPYLGEDGDGISMVVLLPTFVPNAVDDLVKRLTPELLQEALEDGMSREVELHFPKISFEKTYELVPVLTKLGIGNLFDSSADLSGFFDEGNVNLDDAVHKAKIEINEEGSTAAAATVLFSFRSSRPLEPAQFFCNHPFLFLIYDHKSKGILFTGVYKGPSHS